jgi:hypothetical protein
MSETLVSTPRFRSRRRRTGSTRAKITLTRPKTPVRSFHPLIIQCYGALFQHHSVIHHATFSCVGSNSFAEDERSIKNKLAREEKRENEKDDVSLDEQRRKQDATLPARAHGNEPSKGAKIDQEIREEEEEELRRKGKLN